MSIFNLEEKFSEMKLVEDYTWEKFLEAYKSKNSTFLYSEDYPEFDEYSNKTNSNYIPFIKKALSEKDPQYLLDTFIDALLEDSRYISSQENLNYLIYIDILIKGGAKIPLQKILLTENELSMNYQSFEGVGGFESDVNNYPIRVNIMKKFIDINTIKSHMKFWDLIVPNSLETIKNRNKNNISLVNNGIQFPSEMNSLREYNNYIKNIDYNKYSYIKSLYLTKSFC